MSDSIQPTIRFDWGVRPDEPGAQIEITPTGLNVTLHPGLSIHQVNQVAHELGEHGTSLLQRWQDFMGLNVSAT